MVIALLVVGPKRLPVLAGQVGRWIGKAKLIVANIRADIESEIGSSTFSLEMPRSRRCWRNSRARSVS